MFDDGSEVDPGDSLDYEALLATAAEQVDFPPLDEDDAAMMCYTSGTTGDPKGVAYSHRAMVLHSFSECMVDTMASRSATTIMPIVPMFHANAWGCRTPRPWSAPSRSSPASRRSPRACWR